MSRPSRPSFLLATLLVVSVLLITLHFREDDWFIRSEETLGEITTEIGDFAETVFSPFTDVWESSLEYDAVVQENRQLHQRIDELQGSSNIIESATEELDRLREVLRSLDLTHFTDLDTVLASVVVPLGNFQRNTLEISKGSDEGLRQGMPVVVNSGLVGRIMEVRPSSAIVEVITTPDFLVGIKYPKLDRIAPARSDGEVLVAEEDLALESPLVGDLVETSGLAESVYPPGVPVGEVISVDVDEARVKKLIKIRPHADVESLTVVSVLLYTSQLNNNTIQ